NIDTPAIRFPARNTGGVMLVGIRDAAIVLFFKLVLFGVGGWIAAQPELLDEVLAFFIGVQVRKSFAFLVGDDVGDVLVKPLLVGRFQLFAELFFLFPPLLLRHGLRHRLALIAQGGIGFLFAVVRPADDARQTKRRNATWNKQKPRFHRHTNRSDSILWPMRKQRQGRDVPHTGGVSRP